MRAFNSIEPVTIQFSRCFSKAPVFRSEACKCHYFQIRPAAPLKTLQKQQYSLQVVGNNLQADVG